MPKDADRSDSRTEQPDRIRFPTQADHPQTREERIRTAAFRRFIERGGEDGHDVEDWLDAELEVDRDDEPASPPR